MDQDRVRKGEVKSHAEKSSTNARALRNLKNLPVSAVLSDFRSHSKDVFDPDLIRQRHVDTKASLYEQNSEAEKTTNTANAYSIYEKSNERSHEDCSEEMEHHFSVGNLIINYKKKIIDKYDQVLNEKIALNNGGNESTFDGAEIQKQTGHKKSLKQTNLIKVYCSAELQESILTINAPKKHNASEKSLGYRISFALKRYFVMKKREERQVVTIEKDILKVHALFDKYSRSLGKNYNLEESRELLFEVNSSVNRLLYRISFLEMTDFDLELFLPKETFQKYSEIRVLRSNAYGLRKV